MRSEMGYKTDMISKIRLRLLILTSFLVSCSLFGQETPFESIPYLGKAVEIDGHLDDWRGHGFDALGCDLPYEKSFSGIFYTGWTKDGLYFATRIRDNQLYSPEKELRRLRSQDCLELFLDVRGKDYSGKHPESNGTNFNFDYFVIKDASGGETIVDSLDSAISFEGGDWKEIARPNCYEGSFHRQKVEFKDSLTDEELKKASFKVELPFVGNKIKMASVLSSNGGIFNAFIDGRFEGEIDLFDYTYPKEPTIVFESRTLKEDKHILSLEYAPPRAEGIFHSIIRPGSSGGLTALCFFNGRETSAGAKMKSIRTPMGWNIEGFIGWEALGGFKPKIGESIRFGYKLYDSDSSGGGGMHLLGMKRHGSNTTSNWVAKNPDRFPKLRLAKAQKNTFVDCYAKEILFQDKTWIEIDIKTSALAGTVGSIPVRLSSSNGARFNFELEPSSGKEFLRLKRRIPSDKLSDSGKAIKFKLNIGGLIKEKHVFRIEQDIKNSLDHIERTIPENEIALLSEVQADLARLLKQAARELAGFYEDRRNRNILHYHYLNMYNNQTDLKKHIDSFIAQSKELLGSKGNSLDEKFSNVQAWQSKIDGSWQFFTIELPDDLSETIDSPIRIEFHISNKRNFWPVYKLIKKIRTGEVFASGVTHRERDILIRPMGRGNSSRTLGDEEFLYIMDWIREKFPDSANKVYFTGSSMGSVEAVDFAEKFTDIPSYIDLNSPVGQVVSARNLSSLYDRVNSYQALESSYMDKLSNLEGLPIRVCLGAEDERFFDKGRKLFEGILRVQKGQREICQLDIIDGEGHAIRHDKIPSLRIKPLDKSYSPERFTVQHSNLRYGKAYGVSALEKKFAWRPFSLKVSRSRDGNVQIATENLSALALAPEQLDVALSNGKFGLVIDENSFEISSDHAVRKIVFQNDGGAWKRIENGLRSKFPRKGPRLQGPIGDVEREGFLIVYGTMDDAVTSVLSERAKKIVDDRTGSDTGQWASGIFRVKADVDVTAYDRSNYNLWLIGNERENRLVKSILSKTNSGVLDDSIAVDGRLWMGNRLFLEMITLNPEQLDRYVYIEASQSPEGYASEILKHRSFDFAISDFDSINNEWVARGVFDSEWGLNSKGARVWLGKKSLPKNRTNGN